MIVVREGKKENYNENQKQTCQNCGSEVSSNALFSQTVIALLGAAVAIYGGVLMIMYKNKMSKLNH